MTFNNFQVKFFGTALADSSAVRFRTLPLRVWSSISSAVADFASACIYLCLRKLSCVDLYVRPLVKNKKNFSVPAFENVLG